MDEIYDKLMKYNYLSVGIDAKTKKGEKKGYLTGILYMAPHTIAGGKSLCPFSTPSCRAVCLYTAGRGGFNVVQQARIRKAREFQTDSKKFVRRLHDDVEALVKQAAAKDMLPAVRLNGTTDILWEKHGIMQAYPDVQFYDYTKYPSELRPELPENYHLTFSHSEHPQSAERSKEWFQRDVNTAIVFRGILPTTFLVQSTDVDVINGDESDLRFLDPKGVIVGLKVKGKARPDGAGKGFVVAI